MERLLEDFTPTTYPRFAKNALCIRVEKSKFKKYILEAEGTFPHQEKIQLCRWSDGAKEMIALGQKQLFRKKHWI